MIEYFKKMMEMQQQNKKDSESAADHSKPGGKSFPAAPYKLDKKQDDESTILETIANSTNTAGNIWGGIEDHFYSKAWDAKDSASNADKAAKLKGAKAKKAAQAAGSGSSRLKSLKASKAQKAANAARKSAIVKNAKAARLLAKVPKFAKFMKKLPLGPIGGAAAFTSKALTSPNATTVGKGVDATATAGLDVAFGASHPIAAAIDAAIGLVPGGDKVNISNTMSDSVSSITTTGEGIWTGDTRGMSEFYDRSMKGENTWFFKKAAEIGTEYGEFSEDRVQTVGDFWGGADSKLGRAAAFTAAVPGISDVGEGLGWAAFKGYEKGGEAIDYIDENTADSFDEVDWGRTFSPWEW